MEVLVVLVRWWIQESLLRPRCDSFPALGLHLRVAGLPRVVCLGGSMSLKPIGGSRLWSAEGLSLPTRKANALNRRPWKKPKCEILKAWSPNPNP